MSQHKPDPQRRRLLAAARDLTAMAAGAAVAVPTTAASGVPAAPGAPRPAEAPRGYRESEHTRRYYQLARY